MHYQAKACALQEFEDFTKFGSEASREQYRNYLKDVIGNQFKMLSQVNKSNKLESEQNAEREIQKLANEFEIQMRLKVRESGILSNEELSHLHRELVAKASECYNSNEEIHEGIKDKYYKNLVNKIDRSFEVIKADNGAKIKIENEQNGNKRTLLKWQLEYSLQYREELRTMVERHVTEAMLQHEAEQRCKDLLDRFHIKALDEGLCEDIHIWEQNVEDLEQRLLEELKNVQQFRKEKEVF